MEFFDRSFEKCLFLIIKGNNKNNYNNNMEEQWKQIKDYPNYEASDLGRIRNKKTKRIISAHIQNSGYTTVCLSNKGITKTLCVHRLVLTAFEPKDNANKLDVHHKDYDKTNNRLDNLEWTTRKQNLLYGTGPNELRILESILHNAIKKALHQWYDKLLNVKITKECWTEEVVNNAIEQANNLFLEKNKPID